MAIESEYEVKFHVYDGNEKEIDPLIDEYEQIRKKQRTEGSVMSRVVSYFFEGMVELLKADKRIWSDDYLESFKHYNEANKMFNRFKNSRNVQVRLDFLADRMIKRSEGMMKVSEGMRHSEPKFKEEVFQEALKLFNEEVEIANKLEETMSAYAAFSRASFAESQYLVIASSQIKEERSGQAKKHLMKARNAIRQAAFIDPRFKPYYHEIEDLLDDLTKNRIIVKAEELGDKATISSEDGAYLSAKRDFKKASLFYKRASTLASDTGSRRFLLSSATIYEASELEAEANQLFRRENEIQQASDKFSEASKQVEKAIALMGRFGSENLELSFTSQRDYYKAMSLQTMAISLYDQEKYVDSKEEFQNSLDLFNKAIETAKKAENEAIVVLGNDAKADITGYISMCEAMIK